MYSTFNLWRLASRRFLGGEAKSCDELRCVVYKAESVTKFSADKPGSRATVIRGVHIALEADGSCTLQERHSRISARLPDMRGPGVP